MIQPPNHEHCYHPTGLGYSNSYERAERQRCCHCGAEVDAVYRMITPAGHGAYAPQGWQYAETRPLPRAG